MARAVIAIESVLHDVQYALRGFVRQPLYAATVADTIAIGIAVLGTAFTVVNGYVFRTFPLRDPHSLYEIAWTRPGERPHRFSLAEFGDLKQQNSSFSELTAAVGVQARTDGASMFGQAVAGNYFQMLGIGMTAGRPLLPDEAAAPGQRAVLVLAYETWNRRFGADPAIIGTTLRIGDRPYEVVGVAPRGFAGLADFALDFWVPLTMARAFPGAADPYSAVQPQVLAVFGRLREGVALESAQAEIELWLQRRQPDAHAAGSGVRAWIEPRGTRIALTPAVAGILSVVLAAFGIVLLIACANIANLMLARTIRRRREFAIRLSLGASRWRVVRQLFTESLLLAAAAAVIGVAVTFAAVRAIPAVLALVVPSAAIRIVEGLMVPLDLDVRVIGFVMMSAGIAALLFGLLPALRTTRFDGQGATLRGGAPAAPEGAAARNSLVLAQIAACALFLVLASGMLGGLSEIARRQIRLDIDRVTDVRVPSDQRAVIAARLAANANVEAVAAAVRPPLFGPLEHTRAVPSTRDDVVSLGSIVASSDYFRVFGIPIVRGRAFTPDEGRSGADVVVVSAATAERLWPRQDAVGQTLHLSLERRTLQVIGVARDVISGLVTDGVDATCIYVPMDIASVRDAALLVRTRADAAGSRALLDAEVSAVRGDIVRQIAPMRDVLAFQLLPLRGLAFIVTLIGSIALVLAISGTYSVIAYVVSQRIREFGIRMALGATARRVTGSVVADAARVAAAGVTAGCAGAVGVWTLAAKTIDNVPQPAAPAVMSGAAAVIAAALLAAYLPSRRAGRVDPAEALRHE